MKFLGCSKVFIYCFACKQYPYIYESGNYWQLCWRYQHIMTIFQYELPQAYLLHTMTDVCYLFEDYNPTVLFHSGSAYLIWQGQCSICWHLVLICGLMYLCEWIQLGLQGKIYDIQDYIENPSLKKKQTNKTPPNN